MAPTLKDRIIRIRDEVRLGNSEHYRNSDAVLTWLVLFEVSTMQAELPASLEHVLSLAFENVSRTMSQGKLVLDYEPYDPDVFSMPHAKHEMYMQSLLYWSHKFSCTPGVLVDAYSRVGKAADALIALRMVEKIKDEEKRNQANHPARSHLAKTVPVFALTRPF